MSTHKSEIEELIEELDSYIDSCKNLPMSKVNISVNRDEIKNYIREMELKTPEEIKRYKKIVANQDAILRDAKLKAENMLKSAQTQYDTMLNDAKAQTADLISEHEIMQQAYAQGNEYVADASNRANQIIDKASAEANNIVMSAVQYTDDSLADIQKILTYSMDNFQKAYETMMAQLNKSLEIVINNRQDLRAQDEAEEAAPEASKAEGDGYVNYNVNAEDM